MPVSPNQFQKLTVLLHIWNRAKECSRYEMQTSKGLIPVNSLQEARDYAARSGYSGVKVVPV